VGGYRLPVSIFGLQISICQLPGLYIPSSHNNYKIILQIAVTKINIINDEDEGFITKPGILFRVKTHNSPDFV
jgi:hypothetical protein